MKNEYTITSNQDSLKISILEYVPENPKCIVQIAHGICEYKERYEDFMKFLCKNGCLCVINDHRGHGKSVKNENDLGYFYDDSSDAIVEDLHQITNYIKDKYPNLPLYLLGHSMGSLVVRKYLKKYDRDIDKLIVSGSPSENNVVGLAIFLANTVKLFRGAHHRSSFLNNLCIGHYNKVFPNEIKNAWLNRNTKEVEKYNATEKCNYIFTTNGFINLFKLLRDAYSRKGWSINNPNLNIMFIAGSKDPVIVNESAWLNSMTFLREIGYKNIEYHLYQDARHEVLNEINKDEVYSDVLNFLTKEN